MITKRHALYLKNRAAKIGAKRLKRRRMLAHRPKEHSLHYMQSVLKRWMKDHPRDIEEVKGESTLKKVTRGIKRAITKKPTV